MEHGKVISIITAAVLLTSLIAVPVAGQPPVCQYKGTAMLDGLSIAAGISITAELTDGTPVGSANVFIEDGMSKYNMVVAQVDGVPAEGAALNFYVDEYLGGTSTWNAGENKTLNLATVIGVVPDTSVPDSSGPDTSGPDISGPDTSVPDTSGPDILGPDTSGPDISVPDTPGPDISVPTPSEGWSQSLMLLMVASFWATSWGPGILLVGLVLLGFADSGT